MQKALSTIFFSLRIGSFASVFAAERSIFSCPGASFKTIAGKPQKQKQQNYVKQAVKKERKKKKEK